MYNHETIMEVGPRSLDVIRPLVKLSQSSVLAAYAGDKPRDEALVEFMQNDMRECLTDAMKAMIVLISIADPEFHAQAESMSASFLKNRPDNN